MALPLDHPRPQHSSGGGHCLPRRVPGTPRDSPEVTLMEGEALGAD